MIDSILKFGEKAFIGLSTLRNSWLPGRLAGRAKMQEGIYRLIRTAYTDLAVLDCEMWHTREPVPFANRESGRRQTLRLGDIWADRRFDCAWMHVTGQVPEGVNPADPSLCFLVDISGEGLIVNGKGEALQGITSFSSFTDFRQGVAGKQVVLPRGLIDAEGRIDFWIDAANNDLLGDYYSRGFRRNTVRKLHLASCDLERRALYYDCAVLAGAYDASSRDDYAKEIYAAVNRALKTGDRTKLKPYLEAKNDDPNTFEFCAQGHSHLDLAWLWPIRETIRKGARTFASQILNLEAYPGAMFGASQAQLYAWMKERYPEIYAKVKALQAQGRWDIQGASWVEPDSNLIGGESMIRQFYYGKKFFREEFGFDPRILWLVDSFGYNACFPQAAALADVPYFVTQKLSWNTVNEFPYHTFHWQGLDGTPVLAHMLPENTYNGSARPDMLAFGERNYKERAISRRAISCFGIGDGGGGPGFEHYERAQRLADLKGLPKYTQEGVHSFFAKLAAEDKGNYPAHRGELYLEKHQGCYTTQARAKKFNRQCEFLLRNYELLAAQFLTPDPAALAPELPISMAELDDIWKEVLLYQFHDILPGSSIDRVYNECFARYEVFTARLQEGVTALLERLYGGGAAVNLNSFGYQGPMLCDGAWRAVSVPAFGGAKLADAPALTEFHARAFGNVIENDCARVTFKDGVIVSFLHKPSGLEMARGPMNVFSMYVDFGNCWDIHPHFYHKCPHLEARCTAFSIGTDGAKAYAQVEYKIGKDTIAQEISLTDGSPLLRFSTRIQHASRRVMLRVRFGLRQAAEASYNLPFGHIKRAMTENNSIEKAQFETSGQKFVDVSYGDYGLSLLNDCKYGFRCKNGVLDIDVIRSPWRGPGTNVDFGENTLEYALYPHEGPLGPDTYREAYFLNNPILLTRDAAPTEAPPLPFIHSGNPNIVAESVKIAGDGDGLLLRVYNCSEEAQSGEVRVAGYRAAEYANVMEEALAPATGFFELHGFELKIARYVRA